MFKFIKNYLRLKMKYEVEAERYEVLRNSPLWTVTETGLVGDLRGQALDKKIDEHSVKIHQAQIEGLNKAISSTNGYDSAMTYIKERAKHELKIVEIEERWS